MHGLIKTTLTVALLAGLAAPALAQNLPVEEVHAGYRETGSAKDWVGIFRPAGPSGNGDICAIYSRPVAAEVFEAGEAVERMRGELAAFINWNETEPGSRSGEVSFMMGTPVQEGVQDGHKLVVDEKSEFALVGIEDRLYVQPEDDEKVVAAIRAGREMTVTGALEDGTIARDGYSLMGVVATTSMSKESCD